MKIKTIINGKATEVEVREFAGMYQILTGPYAMGIIRKDEIIS
jgi:hypothetical protein